MMHDAYNVKKFYIGFMSAVYFYMYFIRNLILVLFLLCVLFLKYNECSIHVFWNLQAYLHWRGKGTNIYSQRQVNALQWSRSSNSGAQFCTKVLKRVETVDI